MTLQEFNEHYRKMLEDNEFKLRIFKVGGEDYGCIRLYKGTPEWTSSICFCPITAVCFHLTNRFWSTCNVAKAAEEIGLDEKNAKMIADLADNV